MKKQTRKLLALLICLVLAVGLLPMSALADEQGTKHRAIFTADDVTAKAGETVDINVNITENEGIAAAQITLSCDQVVINDIDRGDWVSTGIINKIDIEKGIYDWTYSGHNCDDEGVYAVYTVTINDNVEPGEYPITIVAEDLAGVDADGKTISYKDGEYAKSQTYIATLTVTEGEPDEPLKHRAIFTADDVTAKAGETVDINVNITENEGIAAGMIRLTCDQITITKIKQGDWAIDKYGKKIGSISSYNPEEGIWDWVYTEEIDTEGVYCTYTATINADVAPGEYPITIIAEDLAGVDADGNTISYRDGEYAPSQTYIATLTVIGDEPAPSADVVVDTVTATCGEGETADVNISYVGESEISSIRMTINSEIPVKSITSDYEFEYNEDNNMIIIWAKNGENIGESVIATLHFGLDVDPWYDNGEYPVNIEIVEATDSEADVTELTAENGALIIDNVYKPGDVNMDGTVDNRDVIMIARYLVELVQFNEKQMEIADFNSDSNVNNTDLVLICQSIVNK